MKTLIVDDPVDEVMREEASLFYFLNNKVTRDFQDFFSADGFINYGSFEFKFAKKKDILKLKYILEFRKKIINIYFFGI